MLYRALPTTTPNAIASDRTVRIVGAVMLVHSTEEILETYLNLTQSLFSFSQKSI